LAALAALALEVSARLDATNLDEDEENHLMNDLGAIQSAQESLATALPDIRQYLPFGRVPRA